MNSTSKRLPDIPSLDARLDWGPAIQVARNTLRGKRRKKFHAQVPPAQKIMMPMLEDSLRAYVISEYQRSIAVPPSALIPKLQAIADGREESVRQRQGKEKRIAIATELELRRAASQTGFSDREKQAEVALQNVRKRIAFRQRHYGQSRHAGDKELDHLIGSFNSAWFEGFEEIPTFTPYRGTFPTFLRAILESYAKRLPDEYESARVSLLNVAVKRTALRKRFRNTGLSKLVTQLRRFFKN